MGLLFSISSDIKPTDIFITLLCLISVYVFYFYYKYFTRVNPLPGPIPIPLIGSFVIFKGDIDAWFYELSKDYGENGVYELNIAGNRQIVFTRAEHVEEFFSPSFANSHVRRTANNGLLNLFDLNKKGVALNHDYERWRFNRHIFSQAAMSLTFSPKPSKFANDLFEEMSNYWIDLKPKDNDAIIIDVAPWMRRLACDFTSLWATEKRASTIRGYYRQLKNEATTKEMIESEGLVESINFFVSNGQMIFVPKYLKGFPFIKNRVEKLLKNNEYLHGRLEEIVRKKRKEIKKNVNVDKDIFKSKELDLLTSLIIANTEYDAHPQKNADPSLRRPMTDEEIRGVMFDAFVGGTDTTVNTFCYILYYVSHNPNVKKKLLEEIESIFGDDTTRQITVDDLEKLKYCEAIIKETSRIRPTASMTSRCSDRPEEVAGYKWPGNTLFIIYIRGINNNPLYWKDPEKFDPERFYDPQEIENQHKNSFLIFGGGSKICPGRKIAMIELKTLLALLYRKFDVELVDMQAPLSVETSVITTCTGLNIKIIPRDLKTCS